MLSPASLRVCCLAVMAPALTKADRQAGCLPVVLSESFCVPKTPDTFNIKDRISENRLKYSFTCGNNHAISVKKRSFMPRACWRTQKNGTAFICRYRTPHNVSSKSLLYAGRVRTQREAKYKPWQSTKTTTAHAGKVKLKHTMNKNTSSIRNMGLAKANTSLGLQSLKQLKRFSKENQSSGPLNVMEDSLNFSDSADSPVQIQTLITDITNSDSDVSPVDNMPCISNNGKTSESILNAVADTEHVNTVSEPVLKNDLEPLSTPAGADVIEVVRTSNTSVILTDLLNSNVENFELSKVSPLTSVSLSPTPVLDREEGTQNDAIMDTEVTDIQVSSSEVLLPQTSDTVLEASRQAQMDIPVENNVIPPEPSISNKMLSFVFTDCVKLPVLNSKYSGNPMNASLFPLLNSSNILTNASRFPQLSDLAVKCPVITDSRFGIQHSMPVRSEKNACCSLSSQELDSLKSMLTGKAAIVNSALNSSLRMQRKLLSAHTKIQLSSLTEHYQRKFQIPCQRPARHVIAKSNKDLLDMKAELLQNEDVKNMSTAALVSLVRKLESSSSSTNRILPPKTGISGSVPEASESTTLLFDPDECSDIKHTSGVLLSALRSVLGASDPYLTDLSEEDSESESDDEETASETETTENTSASWNYMTQRTKLGSRSTWLLARIHELGFRIKEFTERLNELVKAEGSVCFEEPPSLTSSSILESDETTVSTKQSPVKNSFLPLNGFIDRSDACHLAKSAVSESLQSELDVGMCTDDEEETCCRTKPLNLGVFRKRKVVSIPGIHTLNQKFPRMSTVNCICNSQRDLAPCILCTGQYHSTQSVDPDSMALRDRISILDSYFHPALSTEKDIPLCLHLENILKTEAKYNNVRPSSPEPNTDIDVEQRIVPKYTDIRSHRKFSRYARSLSAKYRNKPHRNTKHFRKHKLVFGKWRRLHNKHTLRARNRFRRHSVISSGASSGDSPVHSPMSIFDDGLGLEKRKRDDGQFDIDDVILPCNSRSGRLEEIPYKEIVTPRWRNTENEVMLSEDTDEDFEVMTESCLIKQHEILEAEEKERMKRSALGLNKRTRRNRCDSRADSSGANTPDPTTLFNNQDNVFQIPNFNISAGPSSPASPPATPNSNIVSDDSQPPFGNNSSIRLEKKKISQKRNAEENPVARNVDYDEVPPYESLQFPLSDIDYEKYIFESDHNKEEYDMPSNISSLPASPLSSNSSTSTVDEEDDDETDPEWTVVKSMKNGPELVLKFAKR